MEINFITLWCLHFFLPSFPILVSLGSLVILKKDNGRCNWFVPQIRGEKTIYLFAIRHDANSKLTAVFWDKESSYGLLVCWSIYLYLSVESFSCTSFYILSTYITNCFPSPSISWSFVFSLIFLLKLFEIFRVIILPHVFP